MELYANPWLYNDSPFFAKNAEDGVIGFVYMITNLENGKKYIGKKLFQRSKKVVRKKKRTVRVRTESDWRNYWGSNSYLLEDITKQGVTNFKREILCFCKTKGELSLMEMKHQVLNDVLLKPDEYYNAFIGGKIHRRHVLAKI
jgi:hypothetical protein